MVDSPTRIQQSYKSLQSLSQSMQRPASTGSMDRRKSSRPQTAQKKQSIAVNQDDHLPDINQSARSKQNSALKKMPEGPVRADPFLNYATLEAKVKPQSQIQSQNGASTPSQNAFKSRHQSLQQKSIEMQRSNEQRQQSIKRKLENQEIGRIPNDDIRSQITDEDKSFALKPSDLMVLDQSFEQQTEVKKQAFQTNRIEGVSQQNLRELQTKVDQAQPQTSVQQNNIIQKSSTKLGAEEQKQTFVSNSQPTQTQQSINIKKSKQNNGAQKNTNVQNKPKSPSQKKKPAQQNKFKGLSDGEVLEYLTHFCSSKVNFTASDKLQPPADLDSTDSIDSFIMAILQVNADSTTEINQEELESLHLAAGTRNNFCRQLLQGLIDLQNKEQVFQDSFGFFQESIIKLLNVTAENDQRKEQIEVLEKIKEELTMKMFDYQKKLTDTSTSLLKLRQTEFEQSKLLAATKKQLEHKKAECESLNYMIKNNIQQKEIVLPHDVNNEDVPDVPEVDTDYVLSQQTQNQDVNLPQQPPQIMVENANVQIYQQQIQKLSIENKQQQDRINQLMINFESKDRLIQHLENSISQMLVEKEHNVIKLKSEIVLLQNKQSESENTLKTKLIQMRTRIEADEKSKVQKVLDNLKNEIEIHIRKEEDQALKIQRLQDDYKQLSEEFQSYRKEKASQESQRENYLKDLEAKYKSVSEQFTEYNQIMSSKIDQFDSQSLQRQHENETLYLRLKYLKQIAETLVRQKSFLIETIEKQKHELNHQMESLQESMTSQNKSKSYLISVEKSTKQTKRMQELGTNALKNVESILQFLKVEKMYELIFQAEPPVQSNLDAIQNENTLTLVPKSSHNIQVEASIDVQDSVPQANQDGKVGAVQDMLDKLKTTLDIPVQFKAKAVSVQERWQVEMQKGAKLTMQVVKNEEYYLEHCPIELCSILLKFIVQQLVTVDAVKQVEHIPFSISRLIYLANSKSDLSVEREIFDSFLFESKKIIDDEYHNMMEQIQIHDKLKTILPPNAGRTIYTQTNRDSPNKNIEEKQKSPSRASYNILSMKAFEENDTKQIKRAERYQKQDQDSGKISQTQLAVEFESQKVLLETQIQKLKMQLTDHKARSKQVQMGLAAEIVVLQESFDQQTQQHQKELDERDAKARSDIEKFRIGCQQREQQLLAQLQKIQDRNTELEIQGANNQNQTASVISLKAKQILNEGVAGINQQSHNEILRSKKSLHSIIQEYEDENNATVKELQDLYDNFKQNVSSYIDVRESTRSTVSLVFEVNERTQQLINESIVTLYMQKLYQLPKDKIKVLSATNFSKEATQDPKDLRKQAENIALTKILVEIVQETEKLEKQQAQIQAAINDGSSLLFDILPTYMCFNLGNCGLATKNKLHDCHILSKNGLILQGTEFIVTLLRHNSKPDVFMIVAINMQVGQEFVLELNQKDTLTLIDGNVSLLEADDCPLVQQLILQNLALVQISQDKSLYLTCEYRLYFNEVWQNIYSSKAASGTQQQVKFVESQSIRNFDVSIKQRTLRQPIYALSSVRDTQMKQAVKTERKQANYESKLRFEKDQQTDFETSKLYESEKLVYSSTQKVSDQVELSVSVHRTTFSNLMLVEFTDESSGSAVKFSIQENPKKQLANRLLLNKDSAEDFESIPIQESMDDSQIDLYFMQTQVLLIAESQLVLISVERQISQGILIKMHDLQLMQSSQLSLAVKSNGQMTRIMHSQSHQISERFRRLVMDLTLKDIQEQQDTVQQFCTQVQDQQLSNGQEPQPPEQIILNEAIIPKPQDLQKKHPKAFVADALKFEGNPYVRHSSNTETFKSLKERGKLIFRDCINVRLGGNIQISDEDPSDAESSDYIITKSMCSLFIREQTISIEIFLYQSHKISITSSVPAEQLFVSDPFELTASQRQSYVSQMLEKLFVIEVNGKFQMKVDAEAEPVSLLIQRQIEESNQEKVKNPRIGLKSKLRNSAVQETRQVTVD